MEEDSVTLWPRMEPFLLGALQVNTFLEVSSEMMLSRWRKCDINLESLPSQVAPSSKLSLHYLRKMATYVRTRDGCFPVLGWPMWRHIACGKLQLPEDLAWLYFESFDLLVGHTAEERLESAECLSQCSSKSELDQQRSKVKKTLGVDYSLDAYYVSSLLSLPKNAPPYYLSCWCPGLCLSRGCITRWIVPFCCREKSFLSPCSQIWSDTVHWYPALVSLSLAVGGHTAVPPLPLHPAAEPCVSANVSDWWGVAQSSYSLPLSIRPRGQDKFSEQGALYREEHRADQ